MLERKNKVLDEEHRSLVNKKDGDQLGSKKREKKDGISLLLEKISVLEKKVEKETSRNFQLIENNKKIRADWTNYMKQSEANDKQKEIFIVRDFVSDLLPIVDSLMRAFKEKDRLMNDDQYFKRISKSADEIKKIFNMFFTSFNVIYQNLISILSSRGVKEIVPKIGDKPDPSRHEVISVVGNSNGKEGNEVMISQVDDEEKGYMIEELVIRPAKIVAKVKKGK